jgi:hypothetical protein
LHQTPEPLDARLRHLFPARWPRLRTRLGVERVNAGDSRATAFTTTCLALAYDLDQVQNDVDAILSDAPMQSMQGLFPVRLKWLAVGRDVIDSFEGGTHGANGDRHLSGIHFGIELERLLRQLDESGAGRCKYGDDGTIWAHLDGANVMLFVNSQFDFGWGSYRAFRGDVRDVLYQIASFLEEQEPRCIEVQSEIGEALRRWRTYHERG